jgi:prepilin-type N-terminal cleavage/methylation domain-containing protein
MSQRRRRTGFSLIEVMVALTMLALVTVSLARASTAIAVFGHRNDLIAKRTAVLQMEANKFQAVPFATLATWSTSNVTRTWGDFTYTRRLSIVQQTTSRDSIKIVVVPSSATSKPDSVTFIRTKASGSPLCVGC